MKVVSSARFVVLAATCIVAIQTLRRAMKPSPGHITDLNISLDCAFRR